MRTIAHQKSKAARIAALVVLLRSGTDIFSISQSKLGRLFGEERWTIHRDLKLVADVNRLVEQVLAKLQ